MKLFPNPLNTLLRPSSKKAECKNNDKSISQDISSKIEKALHTQKAFRSSSANIAYKEAGFEARSLTSIIVQQQLALGA